MARWACLFAGALLVTGCGISKDVYQRDVNGLRMQIASVEKDKQKLIEDRQRLLDQLTAIGKEKGVLSKDLQKALRKVEELKAKAAKRKAALERLKARLQDMVAAGKLRVRTHKGRMVVEMAEKVLFDVGRYRLTPEGRDALAELTPILASLEGRQFQVAGHTDDTGTDRTNWILSLNRAREVLFYMIEMGMPPERLSAAGYGKYQPVASNETEEGRAQNRRIEIVLVPNIEELMGFEE